MLTRTDELFDGTKLAITLKDSTVVVDVTGVEPAIVEIGEQFAWLGAALRTSNCDWIADSNALIEVIKGTGGQRTHISHIPTVHFTMDYQVKKLALTDRGPIQTGSCWHLLFKNPVIARGFPIPARTHGEQGLEIPLNIMAGLAEATRITNFDDSLVMKGFSTMLVLTRLAQGSLIWHFLCYEDGRRIPYMCALETQHVPASSIDLASLKHCRHFLGWASDVTRLAGKSMLS